MFDTVSMTFITIFEIINCLDSVFNEVLIQEVHSEVFLIKTALMIFICVEKYWLLLYFNSHVYRYSVIKMCQMKISVVRYIPTPNNLCQWVRWYTDEDEEMIISVVMYMPTSNNQCQWVYWIIFLSLMNCNWTRSITGDNKQCMQSINGNVL